MNYFFHPSALAEHKHNAKYYQQQQANLGRRYVEHVTLSIQYICEMPQRFKIDSAPNIRKASLKAFPYNILFREQNGSIQILAIAHKQREPGYWNNRI